MTLASLDRLSLDRPLIAARTGAAVGQRILVVLSEGYADSSELQPVIVVRHATRAEFIRYWQEKRPEAYANSVKVFGAPPEQWHYLEVSTD